MTEVYALIPTFNEAKTIAKIVQETLKYVDEIVVCDDGSNDLSGDIAEKFGATVLKHSTNLGYGAALQTLFSYAKKSEAQFFVTLDADGQHDPSEIKRLLHPLVAGKADIVIGSRILGKSEANKTRSFGARVLNSLTRLPVSDSQSGFRAYNRKALETISVVENGMSAGVEILLDASKHRLRIIEVPVTIRYKGLDTGSLNIFRHGWDILQTTVKFAVEGRPLLYFGFLALFFGVGGAYFTIQLFYYYYSRNAFITNIALIGIALLIFCGLFTNMALSLYVSSQTRKEIRGLKH